MPLSRRDYILSAVGIDAELRAIFDVEAALTIFDIGACEGEDAIRYARLFPNSAVIAVEPLPSNVERIRTAVDQYRTPNVRIVPFALSNVAGAAEMYVSSGHPDDVDPAEDWDYGNKSSSLLPPDKVAAVHPWIRFDSIAVVRVTTLSDLCGDEGIETVDFIHLDVQGAELLVLEGAGRLLPTVKAVWLEVEAIPLYRGQPLRSDVEAFMVGRGFVKVKDTVGSVAGDQLWVRPDLATKAMAPAYRRRLRPVRSIPGRLGRRIGRVLRGGRDRVARKSGFSTGVGLDNARKREKWVEAALGTIPDGWRILDVGAGEQPYRRFCSHLEYVSQDLGEYDGAGDGVGLQQGTWVVKADIVSDLTEIPVPDSSFDAILCTEVLEHVPDPARAIVEFGRIVRPGGALIITAPFVSLTHQAPSHFCTGLSRYWHEWHLRAVGFEIDEIASSGNYFDFIAQEERRIADVASRYKAGSPGLLERTASHVILRWLTRLSRMDTGSSELLTYGWHVRATRR